MQKTGHFYFALTPISKKKSKKESKKKDVRFWCKLTLIAFVGMVAALIATALDTQAIPWLLAVAGFMAIFAAGNLRIDAYNRRAAKRA